MADINECSMQGVCQNGVCLNTLGSFKCSCKAGWVLERNGCVGEYLAQLHPILGSSWTNWNPPPLSAPSDLEAPAEQGQCFRIVSESRGCEHALPTYLTQAVCCCTVGKAWGPNCEPCPQMGTGEHGGAGRRSRQDLFSRMNFSSFCMWCSVAFSKICPAGKGYFLQNIREIFAIPPIIFPRKDGESVNAVRNNRAALQIPLFNRHLFSFPFRP